MWTRQQIKNTGRSLFHISYWKTVLAALILAIASGGINSLGQGNWFTYKFSYGSGSDPVSGHNGIYNFSRSFYIPSDLFGALNDFKHHIWPFDTAGTLVFTAITLFIAFISVFFGILLKLFIFAPLEVGSKRYFVLNHYMNGKTGLDNIAYAFSDNYLNVVKTMFLKKLYIVLWSLLLVVPGIIKAYSYRMVPYILAEEPGMDTKEAFRLSEYMMEGEKWNAFVLDLSFIGWDILNGMTAGILGLFYVNPYKSCTYAELYTVLKTKVVPSQPA